MTLTETDTDLATLIGETASGLLPADEGWQVTPGDAAVELPSDPTAVGAQVGDHAITLVVSREMDRRIQVGPPPADGVLDGVAPAVAAIAQVLGLGEPAEMVTMDPEVVAADATDRSHVCVLRDGTDHLVTIIVTPPGDAETEAPAASFQPIVTTGGAGSPTGLEVLHDVEMGVTVELGRTRMLLRDILGIVPGSVIELDRAASSPVDVLVNGTLIARGEVVVIDEEFGIRVTEIVGHDQTVYGDGAAS